MASRPFPARYDFRCACCGDEQPQGTEAYYGDDHQLRAADPDHTAGNGSQSYEAGRLPTQRMPNTMPHGKTAKDRCDRCFIVHASGQEGCYE